MRILWCEIHRAAVYEPLSGALNPHATDGVCIIESDFGLDDPANCRMVPMRLIPDNARTIDRLAQMVCRQPANAEGHNLECRDFAESILAALDGETP